MDGAESWRTNPATQAKPGSSRQHGSEGFLTEGISLEINGLGSLPPVINLDVSPQIQTIMGETCWQLPFKQKGCDGVFLRI